MLPQICDMSLCVLSVLLRRQWEKPLTPCEGGQSVSMGVVQSGRSAQCSQGQAHTVSCPQSIESAFLGNFYKILHILRNIRVQIMRNIYSNCGREIK